MPSTFQSAYTSFTTNTVGKIFFPALTLSDWTRWGIRRDRKTTWNPGYVLYYVLLFHSI